MIEQGPPYIIYAILILCLFSFFILNFGKSTWGNGRILAFLAMACFFCMIALDANTILSEPSQLRAWTSSWILPKEEPGSMTMGTIYDFLSLVMHTLVGLIATSFLINPQAFENEPHPNRSYSALLLYTAGVTLSWSTLTPWVVFVASLLTIFGALIFISSRWDSHEEADLAVPFIWQMSLGLLLAFFGACIGKMHWIGSLLLVLGLFIQMQPFPFVASLRGESQVSFSLKILYYFIFPAWSSFSLLIRFYSDFNKIGVFPFFGWVALGSTLLLVLLGLFQTDWKRGFSIWLTASFSLATTLIAMNGPSSGMAFFLGTSLSALCLSSSISFFNQNQDYEKQRLWTKIVFFLATFSATGGFGFLTATGAFLWILKEISLYRGGTFFLFILLGWKLFWQQKKYQKKEKISFSQIFCIFLWISLSLGVLWTGSITGSLLYNSPDQIASSLLQTLFNETIKNVENANTFFSLSSFYWGLFISAFFTSYWMARCGKNQWEVIYKSFPKTTYFMRNGYGSTKILAQINKIIDHIGVLLEFFINETLSSHWIPAFCHTGVKIFSQKVHELDTTLTKWIEEGVRKCVVIPGKTLQLIQTGKIRWYLFFSLATGFALMFHFLKNF